MGIVAERYRRDSEQLIASLPDQLAALKGPGWKKLKKLMERRRRQNGPPDTRSPDPSTPHDPEHDDAPGPGGSVDPSTPWPHSFPPPSQPGTTAEDDSDWEDLYVPALRSVPVASDTSTRLLPPERTGAPESTPPSPSEPLSGGRRKEPVFLPATSPTPARPGPGRPASPAEPPEDWGRSSHDRP
jgi:hypothetical protein